MSLLTDNPSLGFPFMVEKMFNFHHPNSITTSLGLGKAQVTSAPIGRDGLHILSSGSELDACGEV
jgi:hypothetical protein